MSVTPPMPRFGRFAQALHWLTAVLVVAAFVYGPGGPEARVYQASRDTERLIHETLGFGVLLLTVLRIGWRLVDARPAPVPMAAWMEAASKSVQALLYTLLLVVPGIAVLGAWLQGHAVVLAGGLQLAPPMASMHDLGNTLAEVHGWLGDVILWLAGLHAAAALYHHHVLKDGVLLSMLPPGWGGQRKP